MPASPSSGDAGSEFAPAKINLALHVTGRRADGYHDLESLVVFARDVGDTIAAAAGSEWHLDITGPFAPALAGTTLRDNLVLRACAALAAGRPLPPQTLTATKRIPVAAGLGGGSADAAATLRLLNRACRLELGIDTLVEIGRPLGADVPMCVHGRALIAQGVGEKITPVRLPELALVLACPPAAVRTADVFSALGGALGSPLPPVPSFSTQQDVCAWLRATRNDLAAPAVRVSSDAVAAAAALEHDSGCLLARMTGSGPAAFGIFPSFPAAERAAGRLRSERPGWWVAATTTGGS